MRQNKYVDLDVDYRYMPRVSERFEVYTRLSVSKSIWIMHTTVRTLVQAKMY